MFYRAKKNDALAKARVWVPFVLVSIAVMAVMQFSIAGLMGLVIIVANVISRIKIKSILHNESVRRDEKLSNGAFFDLIWGKRGDTLDGFLFFRRFVVILSAYFLMVIFCHEQKLDWIVRWVNYSQPIAEPFANVIPFVAWLRQYAIMHDLPDRYLLVSHLFAVSFYASAVVFVARFKKLPKFPQFAGLKNPTGESPWHTGGYTGWLKTAAASTIVFFILIMIFYQFTIDAEVQASLLVDMARCTDRRCVMGKLFFSDGVLANSYLLIWTWLVPFYITIFLPILASTILVSLKNTIFEFRNPS